MSFKVGDKVFVLDDDIDGVIKTIVGETITIETEDGFDMEFESHEIIPSNTLSSQGLTEPDMSSVIKEKEQSHKPRSSAPPPWQGSVY